MYTVPLTGNERRTCQDMYPVQIQEGLHKVTSLDLIAPRTEGSVPKAHIQAQFDSAKDQYKRIEEPKDWYRRENNIPEYC